MTPIIRNMVSADIPKSNNTKGNNIGSAVYKVTLIVLYGLLTAGTFIQAALPALMKTLAETFPDMTAGKLGYIAGTVTLTMAAGGVVMGYFADKINRLRVAFVGSVITTVFTFLSGTIVNYIQFFVFQVCASIGMGAVGPIMASIISDLYDPRDRGKAFAALSVFTTIIGQLGGVLVALMLAASGNWRWTYFILGIIGCILTPMILFIREPKKGAGEDELREVYGENPMLDYIYKIRPSDLKYLWVRRTNFFLIANFVDNIPGAVIATYALTWLQVQHGADELSAYIALLIVMAGIFTGTVWFGKYGDKKYKTDKSIRVKLGTVLSMVSAPFILTGINLDWHLSGDTIILADPIAVFAVGMIAVGLMFDAGIYPNWMPAIIDVNLPEHRNTMISLANFFDACGRALGAFIGGYLIDKWGYTPAMTFTSLFTILSFVWWVPSLKTFRKDYEEVHAILKRRAEEMRKIGKTEL